MSTNLYKVSKVCWAVTSENSPEPSVFQNVDDATNHLMTLGVKDEEIDIALIEMMASESIRAHFDDKGRFDFSDNQRLEAIGVA